MVIKKKKKKNKAFYSPETQHGPVQRYFCSVYDYVGKADVSKGYWNPKRKTGGTNEITVRSYREFYRILYFYCKNFTENVA